MATLNDFVQGEWVDLQIVMDGLPDAGVATVRALDDLIADGTVELRLDARVRFKPVALPESKEQ